MNYLYNDILNLVSETEDIIEEGRLRNAGSKIYNSVVKPLAKYSGKKALELTKHGVNKLGELDKVSRSKHKLDKINSELYAANLAKDKSKSEVLTKKLSYQDSIHKNLQQDKIKKKQKYIQKTKEMKFRIDELTQSGKEPEVLKHLQEKYQKRKVYLSKLGVNTDE